MRPDGAPAARAWLAEARVDLLWIERTDPHPDLHRRVCYAAQQAAEKAIKAAIVHHGEQPAKTHHLGSLIERVAAHVDVPDIVRRGYMLTEYVATTRYPDDYYELTQAEVDEAIEVATIVVDWVASIIEAG